MTRWLKVGISLLPLMVAGCSTISSTVDSVGDSVNGWMGSDKDLRAPTPLEELKSEFDPVVHWKHEVGEGTDGLRIVLSHQPSVRRLKLAVAPAWLQSIPTESGCRHVQDSQSRLHAPS